jgi:hypothetical protein
MMNEIVQGKVAWARLKNGSKSWHDWVLVGYALLVGRAIAMRDAGTTAPTGGNYASAFNDWLVHNRFDISPSQRAKLLAAMSHLPEIELWRVTLTPLQRQRLNDPGAVLNNYRRTTRARPVLDDSPNAPPLF